MYQNKETFDLVRSRYKDDYGKPLKLTPGQSEIFDIIAGRTDARTQVISYTQYGKSLTVALAVLTRASTFPERWAIVAPSDKKAQIIMGYIIDHIFDNEYTANKFIIQPGESRDRVRRERSKDRVNFKISDGRLGEIFIVSADSRRKTNVLDALMGFGAPNVILDESSLIDDMQYAGVVRMVTGTPDNFLLEIGNPFYRNHFFQASRDTSYRHVNINYLQGVAEGRLKLEDANRAKTLPLFDVLYECVFPSALAIDAHGYSPLVTEDELDRAYVEDAQFFGEKMMGITLQR
jgi:hypothetical protein